MAKDSTIPFVGDLNDDPDIYHILSESTAGADSRGYKQVWLTTGGNNPSYPYVGGDNPVPEDDWDSFEPDSGFEKINLKNAFFDTSFKTFDASPNQVEGTDQSFTFMKDNQGYTWFYGTIFQQAMIPDGLFPGEDPFLAGASESLQEGQLSMLVNDKNQNEVFPAENDQGQKITYYFIDDPWGNEYTYESDGKKLNIISWGPDGEEGTEDDISLKQINGGGKKKNQDDEWWASKYE